MEFYRMAAGDYRPLRSFRTELPLPADPAA